MRPIAYPFRAHSRRVRCFLAFAVVLAGIIGTPATASHSPQYGGTLRVQLHERITTLDPRQWQREASSASTFENLEELLFDRLVRFDDHGIPQPSLAISWQHDASSKQWQFRLRKGVTFTDGSACTPEAVAAALRSLLGGGFTLTTTADSLLVVPDRAMPDLPSQFAAGPYFVFKETADGTVIGTSAFQVSQWSTGTAPPTAVFTANEKCWAGRPFVDKIELTMGVDVQQQGNAIAFGQADVMDLPASQVPAIVRRGVRTASSEPCDLYALQLESPDVRRRTANLGQAISLAIDRASIADVILQRQAGVAGSLLPNWISGYAHLFPAATDVAHARVAAVQVDRELFRVAPMLLIYDSADVDARPVAERVAVNLREVGIMTQILPQGGAGAKPADLQLRRLHIDAPDSHVALEAMLKMFGRSAASLQTSEDDYGAERSVIDEFRVIPLVHLTQSYALGPQVRDWMPPRWGGWRLEDVWLAPALDRTAQ